METTNNPTPNTPPPTQANSVPPPVAAPVAPTPVATEPATEFDDGGAVGKKIDWVGWGFMALGAATIFLIGWTYVRKAKESRNLADTQEGFEARIARLEAAMAKSVNNTGNLIPL